MHYSQYISHCIYELISVHFATHSRLYLLMWCLLGPALTWGSSPAFVSSLMYSPDWVDDFNGNKTELVCFLLCHLLLFCLPLKHSVGQRVFFKPVQIILRECGKQPASSSPPPQPGAEHLCYTRSISTSLAAVLVRCEVVFREVPAVPFGDTFQDARIASH